MTDPSRKPVDFVLIGVGGSISSWHLKAIQDTGVAPVDTRNVLGKLGKNNLKVVRL